MKKFQLKKKDFLSFLKIHFQTLSQLLKVFFKAGKQSLSLRSDLVCFFIFQVFRCDLNIFFSSHHIYFSDFDQCKPKNIYFGQMKRACEDRLELKKHRLLDAMQVTSPAPAHLRSFSGLRFWLRSIGDVFAKIMTG